MVAAYSAVMALAALLFLPLVACLAPPPTTAADIARVMRESHGVPGLVCALVTTDGASDVGAAGVRATNAETPIAVDDRMHLGSCTKAFTATLAAVLVADGKLQWDSTVESVLGSRVAVIEASWRTVTLEQLLRHRAGAPSAAESAAWSAAFACTEEPMVCRHAFVADMLGRAAVARGTFAYSNQGYAVAGRMLEVASGTGKSYETLLTERVLTPLGITRAGFGAPTRAQKESPRGHDDRGGLDDIDNPSAIAPAGTLHMPIGEWAKFIAFHLGAQPPAALTSAATELERLHAVAADAPHGALGWMGVTRAWGGAVLTHSGSNTKWYCVAWLSPEKGFAVLAATNQGGDKAAKACDEACAALIAAHALKPAATKKRERATEALAELVTHDVVWDSPGLDGAGSMPIGNGAFGANVWVDEHGELVLLLSHTDAFSEAERLLKLGRVHIVCTPPLPTAPFSQRMRLAEGAIEIVTGEGDARTQLRVLVDSASNVLHVSLDSATPRLITARLEQWRTERRRLVDGELKSAWVMRDAPASIIVEESADVVLSLERRPKAVAWYHRNESSIVPATLEHQGLGAFSTAFGDPLLQRTFGAQLEGDGFDRVSERVVQTAAPVQHASLRVTAKCSQYDDLEEWLEQLAHESFIHDDADAAAKETSAWWRQRFSASWIFVDEPIVSVLETDHPLRVGFDSNGQNRFDGTLARVRFFTSALTAREVAALAASGEAGTTPSITSGFTVATAAGTTWEMDPTLERNAAWSVDGWIEPARDGVTGRIADKLTAGRGDGFLFDLQHGAVRAIVGEVTVQSEGKPAVGRLSHVALVWDGARGSLTLYLNGAAIKASTPKSARGRTSISQAYATQRAVTLAATNGEFPVKFNGSIFTVSPKHVNGSTFNEDFRNWGGDYWWQNTRLPYHGMLARGDGDRMQSLFRLYFDALRGCTVRAREYHGVEGAYFPETMTTFGTYGNGDYGWNREGLDRNIVQCPYWQWAWNQGLELVAMMLDHYDHTGDVKTLTRKTLPIARAVLAYFDSRFRRDAQGLLVIEPTQSIETYWSGVVNDLPTVVGLREICARLALLPVEHSSTELRALCERVAAAVPPVPHTEDGARFAVAEKFDNARSNCENPELYAVWPFRLQEKDLAVGRASFASRVERMTHGWTQDGMQAARLGLANEAAANVRAKVGNTHVAFRYPTFWGPNFDWLPDQCHGGNLLTTLQEMLLQSDGARLRVLPAWPREWDVRFRLHAAGSTTVTGEVRGGRLVFLEVDPPARANDVVLGEGWR